ncbi:substrate-binding domain-containing protein [Anaerocolumna xylanovorans]|uniref:Ribose transport system substrate-binding protein n=1 Tax=Anaerocolumna xylanovorans DSM 12503 TaxID=1121345 RepID=A0A1M7XZW6_9FIRM|nr:substrate-binding domain-containing protein [Anaerocolumna xylanovorans]SHO44796.1 ribose transport system substrate-binding protein [Anaerocolumna xylanovorans DSM 12503]
MKPIKKILRGLILITATLLFLILYENFSHDKQITSPTAGRNLNESPYTIGWSVYNSDFEFFYAMQEGVLDRANELGMRVITHNQKSSTPEIIAGVSDLIAQGIDALVISPFNPEVMPIVSSMTQNAGIPLVIVDVGTGDSLYDAFIISDNFGGGVLAAEYALKLLEDNNITSKNAAIIKVEETSVYARRRGDAFKRVMNDRGYNIVSEITADSREDLGYQAMKDILSSYGDDLAVVFSENDRMALGAAKALNEADKTGKIMLIGFDGDPAAIDAIKSGLMQGTIAQHPHEMGALGAETAYNLLTGQHIRFDDWVNKMMLVEVNLIDSNGNPTPLVP